MRKTRNAQKEITYALVAESTDNKIIIPSR
jgi:hypothetical protein